MFARSEPLVREKKSFITTYLFALKKKEAKTVFTTLSGIKHLKNILDELTKGV